VLQALYRDRGRSRADLARELGLSRVTISDVVGDLLEERLVVELGVRADSRPGKPATMLDVNRQGHSVIGLDLSSSGSFVGVVTDLDGEVVARADAEVPPALGDEAVVAVETLLRELMALAPQPVLGAGVGTPGIVDDRGVVVSAPNLGWRDVPLQERLTAVSGLPVAVANDANAAVVGERSFGHGQPDMMLVRIGRGVGSGLMIDGRVVGGARHAAGEIGHVVVGTDEGDPCACGNSGCLETWLAMPRIEAHLATPGADRDAVLAEAGRRLGIVLAPIVSTLNLAEVVLAGPRPDIAEAVLAAVESTVRDRTLADTHGDLRLRMTELGSDLVVLGAVVLVLRGQLGVA
jgi:predicted NBD/HSP70 family sugar kinase